MDSVRVRVCEMGLGECTRQTMLRNGELEISNNDAFPSGTQCNIVIHTPTHYCVCIRSNYEAHVTLMMSAESDVFLSQVVLYFNVLLDHIESFATHHNDTVQDAAEKAKIKLASYHQKTSDVYTIAVVLDPRLNVHYHARDTSLILFGSPK